MIGAHQCRILHQQSQCREWRTARHVARALTISLLPDVHGSPKLLALVPEGSLAAVGQLTKVLAAVLDDVRSSFGLSSNEPSCCGTGFRREEHRGNAADT